MMAWLTMAALNARIAVLRDPARLWPLDEAGRAELDRLEHARTLRLMRIRPARRRAA